MFFDFFFFTSRKSHENTFWAFLLFWIVVDPNSIPEGGIPPQKKIKKDSSEGGACCSPWSSLLYSLWAGRHITRVFWQTDESRCQMAFMFKSFSATVRLEFISATFNYSLNLVGTGSLRVTKGLFWTFCGIYSTNTYIKWQRRNLPQRPRMPFFRKGTSESSLGRLNGSRLTLHEGKEWRIYSVTNASDGTDDPCCRHAREALWFSNCIRKSTHEFNILFLLFFSSNAFPPLGKFYSQHSPPPNT